MDRLFKANGKYSGLFNVSIVYMDDPNQPPITKNHNNVQVIGKTEDSDWIYVKCTNPNHIFCYNSKNIIYTDISFD
jgi:hypothetical protein